MIGSPRSQTITMAFLFKLFIFSRAWILFYNNALTLMGSIGM